LDGTSIVGLKAGEGGAKELTPGDHDHVEAHGHVIMTENLPYQSFSPISLYRSTELLRGRNPQPSDLETVGLDEERAIAALNARAGFVNLLELCVPPNPLFAVERHLLAADGQPFAALRATALQHEPAVLATHSDEKTMRPFPVARIGLKCALSLHPVLRKCKRTS
jgi:hypothetical protein